MSRLRHFWVVLFLCAGSATPLWAQTQVRISKPTQLSAASGKPDSAKIRAAVPRSLTFTASTDQRFFFFGDTRNDRGNRMPVGIFGGRVGFLYPTSAPRKPGGKRAAFKTGVGFYFVNQTLNRPGLLPNTSEAVKRHLRIATAFFEPYLFRKYAIELSVPMEIGYGHSRYELTTDLAPKHEVARGVFIPAGVGLAASYQFPSVRRLRPLHWFGINLHAGYRFILKKDVPGSQVNYQGCYMSGGPSFFLENFSRDYKGWRKKRRSRTGK